MNKGRSRQWNIKDLNHFSWGKWNDGNGSFSFLCLWSRGEVSFVFHSPQKQPVFFFWPAPTIWTPAFSRVGTCLISGKSAMPQPIPPASGKCYICDCLPLADVRSLLLLHDCEKWNVFRLLPIPGIRLNTSSWETNLSSQDFASWSSCWPGTAWPRGHRDTTPAFSLQLWSGRRSHVAAPR